MRVREGRSRAASGRRCGPPSARHPSRVLERPGVGPYPKVLFVSVRQTFDDQMRLHGLGPWVARARALTVTKAQTADRVVALAAGKAVGAWSLPGAYPSDETYLVASGDERPRVCVCAGRPAPYLARIRSTRSHDAPRSCVGAARCGLGATGRSATGRHPRPTELTALPHCGSRSSAARHAV